MSLEENRIKILIIDKHEAVRRALRIRLSAPAQLEVIGVAADPVEALALSVRSARMSSFLVYRMDQMKISFKTAIAVRDMVKESPIVIVLAPYVDTVERELLLQAGAKRYLLKHINSVNLIHEIELAASQKPLV